MDDIELNNKLDFIFNMLVDIKAYTDVHYEHEMMGYELGEAELLGFNVEPSKTWEYCGESYEFSKTDIKSLEKDGYTLKKENRLYNRFVTDGKKIHDEKTGKEYVLHLDGVELCKLLNKLNKG